jgi:hypothetical protein
MEISTFLPTASVHFYLLSYWLAAGVWAFSSSFPIPILEMPNGCPTAFESISQGLSATMWQFLSLFSEGPHLG